MKNSLLDQEWNPGQKEPETPRSELKNSLLPNQGRSINERQEVESEPWTQEDLQAMQGEIEKSKEWLPQELQGVEGAFNPAEIFAGIWAGGTTMALRHGVGLARSLLTGAAESVVGTATDVPISLAGQMVQERYGWKPGLVFEMSTSLASGLTLENFLLKKMDSLGRSISRAIRRGDSVTEDLGKSADELLRQMDEMEQTLNMNEDQGEFLQAIESSQKARQLALPPGQGDTMVQRTFSDYEAQTHLGSRVDLGRGGEPIELQEAVSRADIPDEAKGAIREEITPETPAEKPGPGRPSEPLRQPVSMEDRMSLIKQIAKERGATKSDPSDEVKADIALLADESEPRFEDQVPPRRTKTKAQEHSERAQREIEDFLGLKLDGFEGGQVKKGYESEVGSPDEAYYLEESLESLREDELSELSEFDSFDDVERGWNDVLTDLHTAFSNKLGLSIEDVTKASSADKEQALNRLAKDLKKHAYKATRSGLGLQEYYEQLGFTPDVAAKWKKYTEWFERNPMSSKQPSRAGQLSADKEKADKAFSNWTRWLAVEAPFRKIGTPETGFAFKNHASIVDLYAEEGEQLVKKIQKELKLSDREAAEATFKAEDPNYDISDYEPTMQRRITRAAEMWNEYAEKSFKDYNTHGGLDTPFPQSAIDRRQSQIEKLQKRLETAKGKKKATIEKTINRKQDEIDLLRDKKYVPILREFFEKFDESRDSKVFRRVLNVQTKERKSTILKELVDEGVIKPEEVDIRNIIGSYARRKGKHIANLKLRNSMEQEGLIKKIRFRTKEGKIDPSKSKKIGNWTKLDPRYFPAYKDYAVHPVVADYLNSYQRAVGKHSRLEETMNTLKMFQFYNPIFLPMYDMYQTGMLHFADAGLVKAPKSVKDGIVSFLRKDQDYWDAAQNGLFSKPFPNPLEQSNRNVEVAKNGLLKTWAREFETAHLPMGKRMQKILKGLSLGTLRNIYNLSWNTAWMGDNMIRMMSYKYLRNQGMDPRDAGQLAAMFHGDYASVPPQTRKQLNKIFFTPTFKVVMAKAQTEMAKSLVESVIKHGKFKLPDKKTRIMAGGLLGALAANWGKDMLMTSLGFERDQWGRRYYRETETPEGPKEVVVTMSDPTNVMLKYGQKVYESFIDTPELRNTAWGKLTQSLSNELHPAWKIFFSEMTMNEKWDGSRMYSPNDPMWKKGLKAGDYLLGQTVPLVQAVPFTDVGERPSKDQEVLAKEFGKAWYKIMKTFVFPYVRSTRREEVQYKLRQIRQNWESDIKHGTATQEKYRNMQEDLNQVMESLDGEE